MSDASSKGEATTAAISTECAHCGARLKLKSAAALGKSIRCPKCQKAFVAEEVIQVTVVDDEPDSGDQADAGAKKKKKKKKSSTSASKIPVPLLAAAAVFGAAILVGAMFLAAMIFAPGSKQKLETPSQFAEYNARAAFRVDHPADWKIEEGGAEGHKWAKMTKGEASIKVAEKLIGGLMVDIGGNQRESGDDELSAIQQVHEMKKETYSEEFNSYAESVAEVVVCPFGKARRSEFTAKGSWGKKLRGYRVSAAAGNNLQVDIICVCRDSDWEAYQPAFARTIKSLAVGRR